MHGGRIWLLGALLGLAACHGSDPAAEVADVRKHSPTPTPSKVVAAIAPKPTPTHATPTPALLVPSPAASPTAVPAALLAKPTTPTVTLQGTVTIDASYAISAGGAHLISDAGGGVLMVGTSLLSNNGGNVIANNGGKIISNNSGSYGLLAAETVPTLGELLPAGGLVVSVSALQDGTPVSVGADANGQNATAILTNSVGGYTLYLPAATSANVLVNVGFPAGPNGAVTDSRLQYNVLAAPVAATAAIDEDTASMTRYIRGAFVARIQHFMTTTDVNATADLLLNEWVGAPLALRSVILGLVQDVQTAAQAVGLDKAPDADTARVSRQISDSALAQVTLDTIQLTPGVSTLWTGAAEPALPALVDILRQLREGATKVLLADPDHFKNQPYLAAANAHLTAATAYQILKPSDLGDFVVSAYVANADVGSYSAAVSVFADVGVPKDQADRLFATATCIVTAVGQALVLNQGGCKDQALAYIHAYGTPTSP